MLCTVCTVILQRGLCGAGAPPLWVAQDLRKQLGNPRSLLKEGEITSKAVSIEVMASLPKDGFKLIVSHWADADQPQPEPEPARGRESSPSVSRWQARFSCSQPMASEAQLLTEPAVPQAAPKPVLLSATSGRPPTMASNEAPSPPPITASTVTPLILVNSMLPELEGTLQARERGTYLQASHRNPSPEGITAELAFFEEWLGGAAASATHMGMAEMTRPSVSPPPHESAHQYWSKFENLTGDFFLTTSPR